MPAVLSGRHELNAALDNSPGIGYALIALIIYDSAGYIVMTSRFLAVYIRQISGSYVHSFRACALMYVPAVLLLSYGAVRSRLNK